MKIFLFPTPYCFSTSYRFNSLDSFLHLNGSTFRAEEIQYFLTTVVFQHFFSVDPVKARVSEIWPENLNQKERALI